METYDYRQALKNDLNDFLTGYPIEEGETREDYYTRVYDDAFLSDSVTGNGSGTYTFNAYTAAEYLCHNFDLLGEALNEFGGGCDILKDGEEACDVSIRCYLLGEVLADVLDEMDFEED